MLEKDKAMLLLNMVAKDEEIKPHQFQHALAKKTVIMEAVASNGYSKDMLDSLWNVFSYYGEMRRNTILLTLLNFAN